MHDGRLQIGELARRTELSVEAIRFYEKCELLPKATRTRGRFRLYTDQDVARIHFIRQMQALGFSLREIKQLVELRSRKVEACESVRTLLQEKLSRVRVKIGELETLEAELAADLRKCDQELESRLRRPGSPCPVLQEMYADEGGCCVPGDDIVPDGR